MELMNLRLENEYYLGTSLLFGGRENAPNTLHSNERPTVGNSTIPGAVELHRVSFGSHSPRNKGSCITDLILYILIRKVYGAAGRKAGEWCIPSGPNSTSVFRDAPHSSNTVRTFL
jgi:hypothetical protein